ncbi:MAG: LLM class flavin-dependent oxidoreductase [Acidimicrobiia bacterium]
MKVRIGVGLGTRGDLDAARFAQAVDGLEAFGFDSLWLSERISGDMPDPVVALGVAAGRTTRLKLGFSVLVLPGRNPMLLTKQLVTLDRLSGGRLLPAFGLGVVEPAEQQAFGIRRGDRSAVFDELMPVVRALWAGEVVDHDGTFTFERARVGPRPVRPALEVWLGGIANSEMRRCARHGDGWLPSMCLPRDVAKGIDVIRTEAAALGRRIEPDHYGAIVTYVEGPIPDDLVRSVNRRRPDLEPEELVVQGLPALRRRIQDFVGAGATKFVVVPATEPADWTAHLGELAEAVLPLQD